MKKIFIILICACFFRVEGQNIFTVAGTGVPGFSGDGGLGTSAKLDGPDCVVTDALGNLYIADVLNNRIRKVSTSGIISTFAGTGVGGYAGDGGPAISAQLYAPHGLAFDASGNLYVSEMANFRIRKITTSGVISTFAGTGVMGYSGDGGPATSAKLQNLRGLAFDPSGNLYISDFNRGVRKINTSGIISNYAGVGVAGYSGDGGPATNAKFKFPLGIACDNTGNLYIADSGNNCIRKVNTSGIVSTIAGDTIAGFSGDGGPAANALFKGPNGVFVSAIGEIYISDTQNHCIRKINSAGIISTIAGSVTGGFSGDGGAAINAKLYGPYAVTMDALNNLFIADKGNNRIREICSGNCLASVEETSNDNRISIYPNPAKNILMIQSNTRIDFIEVFDVVGRKIVEQKENLSFVNIEFLELGIYQLVLTSEEKKYSSKFIKE